ncbi:cytochrome P450 6a8-like [Armigeres subalbatus]|uniref:cytochrome P450 6a8-like n=1 Tax=Armigeres subalbatus TaxID=124917 RepID=UPI002ED6B396
MDAVTSVLLSAVIILLSYGFYLLRKHLRFFADLNIPHIPASFDLIDKTTHPAKQFQKWYRQFKGQHPLAGILMVIKPIAIPLDLELIKCILVKDFQYFQNRGMYYNEKDDPLSAHLFSLEGAKWRNLRSKISPTFTSGKMKMMYPTMVAAGNQFREYLNEKATLESEFEMRDLLARFTTDIIGTCAFGIECNSMQEPNSKFREMSRKHFETRRNDLKDLFKMTFPNFARFLGITEILPDVSEFFMNVVKSTIEYRVKNKVSRNDFMDLCIGMLEGQSPGSDQLTINEIAAQAYVFFIAGFETSSTTMTWALYELSRNLDIQEKGRKCVQETLEKHNGVMSYEAIMEMTYIDQIINETLRLYPPVPLHFRVATKDYHVPNTDTVLPAGTATMIPVYAIHRDEEIFPEPEKFDPNRFCPEEVSKRHPYAWTPFGEGPRICIGVRFGMMQARIGLVLLLNNFRFSPGPNSSGEMEFVTHNFILTPKQGLWLKVEKI